MSKSKGISLIVLVITIIVMIILAASIILSISNSGLIGKASEGTFKNDLRAAQEELQVYIQNQKLADSSYDASALFATADTLEYDGVKIKNSKRCKWNYYGCYSEFKILSKKKSQSYKR